MFSKAKVAGDYLLLGSVGLALDRHEITEVELVVDESDL